MRAGTVIAISATVIALASLAGAIAQTGAIIEHSRKSVRPILQFHYVRNTPGVTGIKLVNAGIGPAVIVDTLVNLDGAWLGRWEEPTVNALRDRLPRRPRAGTVNRTRAVPVGHQQLLLYLEDYDRQADAWFWDLIRGRLSIEIRYVSVYGAKEIHVSSDAPYDGSASDSALDAP